MRDEKAVICCVQLSLSRLPMSPGEFVDDQNLSFIVVTDCVKIIFGYLFACLSV